MPDRVARPGRHATCVVLLSAFLCPILATWGAAADRRACETAQARAWIAAAFEGAPTVSGRFTGRLTVETPVLVQNAAVTGGAVGISLRRGAEPRAALVSVTVSDQVAGGRYGAALRTHRGDGEVSVFLADVVLRPRWPDWDSYGETNFDGITLDAPGRFFAQSLTISGWNADAAIDNKATTSQIVGLIVSGPGHRPLRYWRPGPHYLVDARIDKPAGGTLIWFRDCDTVSLRIHASSFNGAARLSPDQIACATGSSPDLRYLREDPRQTGEMHPMFRVCRDAEASP